MAAAFAAAGEHDGGASLAAPVGMRHVLTAVRREYSKLARRVPQALDQIAGGQS
jgi:hypothetical protein